MWHAQPTEPSEREALTLPEGEMTVPAALPQITSGCCSPAEQDVCCTAGDKTYCCGPETTEGCGCR
jgi:hypothetical protein